MKNSAEHILLVENDPDISDLIARQALQPFGYRVTVASDASLAIKNAVQNSPDLIIANLDLPGLSGKDLLIALTSQGILAPVIVLTEKGNEQQVIQAFRLGAADFLLWPAREAEVLSAVERVLKQVREGQARLQLDKKLRETNDTLQKRVRELTALLSLGKAVLSITEKQALFDRIVEGAVHVSEADMGWLVLRDERSRAYLLSAHRNLPPGWSKKMGQTVDDGVSALVAMSGESLSIAGEALKRFKASVLGQSISVIPIKAQKEVIGLLIVIRKEKKEITAGEQTLLEAVADYAAISLVNINLFRALEKTLETAKAGEKRKYDHLLGLRDKVKNQVQSAIYPVDLLLMNKMGALTEQQTQALSIAQTALHRLLMLVTAEAPSQPLQTKEE